jgi:two-component system, cell cycle sensor histidine kinase and response regulator CckA
MSIIRMGVNILDMVGASARRGAEMVRQVLSFARGVEGKVEEVEVTQIIEDLVRIIEETFPKNIRLETRLQTDLWVIKADSTQIHQVLLNLCVNARDAMPDGGLITLKVQNMLIDERHPAANFDARPGPYLTIEIADTGHGIPPDIIEKIYDPFFTTKEHGKGTGLGLSTTLAIMKSHCGFITTSSDPGSGARFRLHLPAMTQPGWVAAESPSTKLPRGRGETILVVDDEVYVRQITSQTLEAFGYKVMLAANGSEAVSMYVEHQGQIALVLTDMMMPVMDGHALIRSLRHLNPFVKIIAASGFTSRGRIPVGTGAGATDFLPKPYSAETLLKSIRRLLREPQG